MGVEVLGINLPKTMIVRTPHEAMDVGVNEFGNTLGFCGGLFGGGYAIDKLLNSQRIPLLKDSATLSRGRVIKSLTLIPPLFAFMMAMPFFRNAFTAWQSGTVAYKDLITKGTKHQATQKQETHEAIEHFLKMGTAILSTGILLGALGFGIAKSRRGIRMFQNHFTLVPSLRKGKFPKILKALCLTGKSATEFQDRQAIFYWGIPAYLGWMAASRDKFEVKEQLLKMINFIAVYVLPEKIVNSAFHSKTVSFARSPLYAQLYTKTPKGLKFSYDRWAQLRSKIPTQLAQKVIKFENAKLISGFGLSVLLMAVLPALLNIYLTKHRIQKEAVTANHFTPLTNRQWPTMSTSHVEKNRMENLPYSRYLNHYTR